jgi:hypothetical protein
MGVPAGPPDEQRPLERETPHRDPRRGVIAAGRHPGPDATSLVIIDHPEGPIVSSITPIFRRHGRHAADGRTRLRRAAPLATLITAAAVSASLTAAAVPAITAARPAAPPMISVSGNGRLAAALRAALSRVRLAGDGQLTLASAGLSSRARAADGALVTGLGKVEHQAGTLGPASSSIIDTADVLPAAGQGATVITIVPGTTLTISGTEVMLDISPQDVTEIENLADFGSAIAELVGAILGVIPGTDPGDAIADIVASSLAIGSDALRLCAGNDGGSVILSISAPAGQLPSVSACGISV